MSDLTPPSSQCSQPGPANDLYKELEGEVFQGEFAGYHTISNTAWATIRVANMSVTMEKCLRSIIDKFEGRIWKGIVCRMGGYQLYTQLSSPCKEGSLKQGEKANFKIDEYGNFRGNWREIENYKDAIGYYFVINKA